MTIIVVDDVGILAEPAQQHGVAVPVAVAVLSLGGAQLVQPLQLLAAQQSFHEMLTSPLAFMQVLN